MKQTTKNKSVNRLWWCEPWIELLNDWYVVVNYVLPNDRVSILKHRDGTSNRLLSAFVIEDINLIVTKVFDSNTMNGGDVVVQAVCFDVKKKVHQ